MVTLARALRALCAWGPLGLGLAAGCSAPAERCEGERAAMGTLFRIVLYAPDAESGARAIEAAFARIAELDAALSDYDQESELSQLSARSAQRTPSGPVPLSPELWTVLGAAQTLARESGGAFDVTVGPYVLLWRRSVRQGELPASERLAQAARAVGHAKLCLDAERRTAELLAPDMRLDLGGIAKGFALDEALRVLRARGIEAALVDGGGDVAVGAPPPGRAGWRVELDPLADPSGARGLRLELAHAAVATSGDAYRSVEIDGRRFSHIVDPATGLGLERRIVAAVVAPLGMRADALATAACVLGTDAALALVESIPGVEILIGESDPRSPSGAVEWRTSSGLARLLSAPKGR